MKKSSPILNLDQVALVSSNKPPPGRIRLYFIGPKKANLCMLIFQSSAGGEIDDQPRENKRDWGQSEVRCRVFRKKGRKKAFTNIPLTSEKERPP